MIDFVIVGNSHASIFDYFKNVYFISKPGASIVGLLKQNTKTRLNEDVHNSLESFKNTTYIFYLGQCDIEFSYYYKSVLNNEKLNVDEYIYKLINTYELFLQKISNKIIIFGINPCVVKDNSYNFKICFKDNNPFAKDNENGCYDEKIIYEDYLHIFNDSQKDKNIIHKNLNESLKKMANKNQYNYFDIWDLVIDENGNVKNIYQPIENDCHIKKNNEICDYLLQKINGLIIK